MGHNKWVFHMGKKISFVIVFVKEFDSNSATFLHLKVTRITFSLYGGLELFQIVNL